MVTGRSPSSDHSAISMARLSFALPIFARCERPRAASVRTWRLQPGRLAHGPDEKCGVAGRTPGLVVAIFLSFQIGAPRWGGVSHCPYRQMCGKSQLLQYWPHRFLELQTGTCRERGERLTHR